MLPNPLRTILAILAPAGFIAAAELPPMELPTSQPPAAVQSHDVRLVNSTVPAFGAINRRAALRDSRIETLAHKIQTYTAALDGRVMTGQVHRTAANYSMEEDEKGYPIAVPNEREPLPEELEIVALLSELAILQEQIPFANAYEEWHFDQSWASLQRSAELIRLGLSEDAYLNLERLHAAWTTYYHQSLAKAQAEYALELVDRGVNPSSALAEAKSNIQDIEYPKMALDGQYPTVVIPLVLPKAKEPKPVEPKPPAQPEPAPQPELPATPKQPPIEQPELPAQPPVTPTPDQPAAPVVPVAGTLAQADALFAAGSQLYQQAVNSEDFDQRDQLYNTAELVLDKAKDIYGAAVTDDPENGELGEKLRQASQLRYGAIKQARSDAQSNRQAQKDATAIISDAMSGKTPALPEAPAEEPPVIEEVVPSEPIEEPVMVEPEPEPVPEIVEPEPEPEPDPVAEPEPQAEPAQPDNKEVDEAVEALDELDWPDL